MPPAEAQAVAAANATTTFFDTDCCVHEAIAAQAARTPQQEAIRGQGQVLTYGELDERATALADALARRGVRAGDVVGLCLERTPEMVVALLAIMKAGAAYLPLDPAYPRDRIAFMIEDSAAPLVVTTAPIASSLRLPRIEGFLFDGPLHAGTVPGELPAPTPDSAAYLIYTSGSTGRPKGVVVTHRNVMNLFAGMADRIPHEPPGRWLAVTSLSFDISVLELFWTLAHGFTVVMHSDTVPAESRAPEFSLFYFATDNARDPKDRYKLLLEGAKFADREGFAAIWTPERHFHAFGGLYPNPAVTSAAIAAITTRLQIRAGSCVLPLHHPIRVAEEWAFVDNISQGRVGVSFASGWQPNDFVISPQAFADRKNEMLRNVDVVRRLWRGEAVPFPGPLGKPVDIRTLPRPVQAELPVWLTAAGNPETFQQAGEMGCHLLTHLLGQKIEDVAEKLKLYRAAWRKAGHAGHGHVTLMLHTFVGDDDDEVRETVRGPMKEYLRSSLDLIKAAAWSFPTFVQRGAENGKTPVEIMDSRPLSEEEMDALLEHAFSRYYGTSALFGTPRALPGAGGETQGRGRGRDRLPDRLRRGRGRGARPPGRSQAAHGRGAERTPCRAPRVRRRRGAGARHHAPAVHTFHGVDAGGRCTRPCGALASVGAAGGRRSAAAEARTRAAVAGARRLPQRVRADRNHGVVDDLRAGEHRRIRPAGPADRQHEALGPHAVGTGMPCPRAGRTVHWRRGRDAGLLEASRTHRRALHRAIRPSRARGSTAPATWCAAIPMARWNSSAASTIR